MREVGGKEDLADRGIGLAEAIGALRDELLAARATGGDSDIQLPVESMTVELQVAATRTRDGKAGFAVPIVNVELGGSAGWQRETMQTVTVVFGVAGRSRRQSGEGGRGQQRAQGVAVVPVPLAARVVEVIADLGERRRAPVPVRVGLHCAGAHGADRRACRGRCARWSGA